MPNFGLPDRDLLDRINRLEATVNELNRAHGAPITAIRDTNGDELVQTDPVTGVALQRPYLPLLFERWDYRGWPRTSPNVRPTEAAPETVFSCTTVKQHPALSFSVAAVTSASTVGRIRILLNDTEVWPDITAGQWPPTYTQVGPIAVPGDFLDNVQIKVTVMLDTVVDSSSHMYVQVFNAYGHELRNPLPLPPKQT